MDLYPNKNYGGTKDMYNKSSPVLVNDNTLTSVKVSKRSFASTKPFYNSKI